MAQHLYHHSPSVYPTMDPWQILRLRVPCVLEMKPRALHFQRVRFGVSGNGSMKQFRYEERVPHCSCSLWLWSGASSLASQSSPDTITIVGRHEQFHVHYSYQHRHGLLAFHSKPSRTAIITGILNNILSTHIYTVITVTTTIIITSLIIICGNCSIVNITTFIIMMMTISTLYTVFCLGLRR